MLLLFGILLSVLCVVLFLSFRSQIRCFLLTEAFLITPAKAVDWTLSTSAEFTSPEHLVTRVVKNLFSAELLHSRNS